MSDPYSFNIEIRPPGMDFYNIYFDNFGGCALSGTAFVYIRGRGVPNPINPQKPSMFLFLSNDIVDIDGSLSGVNKHTKLIIEKVTPGPNFTLYYKYTLYNYAKKQNDVSKTDPLGVMNNTCSHEWKHYQGLLDSYNYCAKCDVKDKQ